MATPARDTFSGINLSKVDPGKFQFLVCGKTGVGKSSLINGLVGTPVCKVNDPGTSTADPAASFAPGTLEVSNTSINVKGAPVLAWDSPGLQDGTGNEDQYLQSMCEKCKDVDVVFYCMEMTTARLIDQDKKAAKALTQTFGPEFWKKTVLVLTKANNIAHKKEKDYHKELYDRFVKSFAEILTGEGVPNDITQNIQCVAAGFFDENDKDEKERFIWYASNKTNTQQNEKVDFLPELWAACFEVLTGKSRKEFVVSSRTRRVMTAAEEEEAAAKEKREELRQKVEQERRAREEQEYRDRERERQLRQQKEAMQRQIEDARKMEAPPIFSQPTHPTGHHRDPVAGAVVGAAVGSVFGPVGAVIGGVFGSLFG